MQPFLKQVLDHYEPQGLNAGFCFIFPNRRSQVFFQKYLGEAVKKKGVPIVAPKMLTINDFFFKLSNSLPTDKVNLLLELYDCYVPLNKMAESLDEFIFWADMLISDFDDVDKYLVDAKKLFTNVADFKSIQDSYSYLTDNQRKAIESFIRHFSAGGKLTVDLDSKNPNVKEKFLQVWDILLPLYESFRKNLSAKGMGYEGMVYRDLAERMKTESASDVLAEAFHGVEKFVFVGLNALTECEKVVMRKMRDASLAEFCWDYSSNMIKDGLNKSSFFMKENVEAFPQSFTLDPEGLKVPEIEVIRVTSSVGQAKLIPSLVDSENYAIVVPDESLLQPVLNSIPPVIQNINVTMGYPMSSSAFFDFLSIVNALQMHNRLQKGEWHYYHKQVWAIFASSLFSKAVEGNEVAKEIMRKVRESGKYYVSQSDLSGDPLMELIFQPIITDPLAASAEQISNLCDYQKSIIIGLAKALDENPDTAVGLEFAKKAYNAINRLQAKNLAILPLTYSRLLTQILSAISVPFTGEPLRGLQIMGPLETRALDFNNLIVMSCNEGTFPHRSVGSSFIPPELRRGFSLPTYEYQDAVWAYYFYRMIQRASKVTLIYDSRTEGVKVGEESRYIKQLEYHFNIPLKRSFVKAEATPSPVLRSIKKTPDDIETLKEINFSASSLKDYLDCPAKFFYSKIEGLKDDLSVSEDLDSGMIGNVFHATMQAIYTSEEAMSPNVSLTDKSMPSPESAPMKYVTIEYIDSWLKRKKDIVAKVRSLIKSELRSFEVTGRNLVFEKVLVQYVLQTLKRDKDYMLTCNVDKFEVVGLEKFYESEIGGYNFVGFIDRMDSFLPGELRIIDYKTGKVEDKDVNIDDATAEEIVEKLFGPSNQGRPKIAFQLFLYNKFVEDSPESAGRKLVNSIYQPAKLFTEPVLNVLANDKFNRLVEEKLKDLLHEISNEDVEWARTDDAKTCSYCDFKMICGR